MRPITAPLPIHHHTALRALWGRSVSARAGLPFPLHFVASGQEATPT